MTSRTFERAYLSAVVASGLLAKHGVDHGGVNAGVVAEKSVAIADAIIKHCDVDDVEPLPEHPHTQTEPFSEPKPNTPASIGDSGVAGSELQPVPPTTDPSASQE